MIFPQDIPSAVTEMECAILSDLARDRVVLEVGSDYGRSTVVMAQTARRVVSCDFFVDYFQQVRHADDLPVFFNNLRRYDVWTRVTHIVGDFTSVSRMLAPHQFDLIFIDAIHQREFLQRDIWNSIGLLKVPGVLAMHDYVEQNAPDGTPYNIIQTVNEFVQAFGLSPQVVNTLAIIEVPQFIRHPEYEP